MDLDLDLTPRTRGRPSRPIECEIVRELNGADIALLETAPRGVQPISIKRIRDAHHHIAQLIAQGLRNNDIAAMTGYSQSRISILKGDPAFDELVSFYREHAIEANHDVVAETIAKQAAVRNAALDIVLDAADEGTLSVDQALDAYVRTADRSGFGPQSKSTNVNLNIGIADQLAARNRRTSGPGAGFTPLPSGEVTAAVKLPPPSEVEPE